MRLQNNNQNYKKKYNNTKKGTPKVQYLLNLYFILKQ